MLKSNAFALTCIIFAWFELILPNMKLWFWNIPIRLSFNVWPCLVDGDEQRIATRVPAMLWRGCRLPDEYQHSRVDGAAVLLRASLCVGFYMAYLPATRPAATPDHSSLPPRPSRRNNRIGPEGIGPEGATSLAGPLATLTKLQWLELRYGPLVACGGVALGGREAGRRGNADGLGAREGGNTPLRHVHPSALPPADSLFPQSPVPARYDSRRPSPTQAQHPLQRVGPGGVARAAGRPAVPEAHRPWRRRSLGWAACRTWTSASQGVARRAGIILIILIIEIIVLFVIIYIIAFIVILGVTRWSQSHFDGQTYCNCEKGWWSWWHANGMAGLHQEDLFCWCCSAWSWAWTGRLGCGRWWVIARWSWRCCCFEHWIPNHGDFAFQINHNNSSNNRNNRQ
jgi:hypothetical protein